MKKQFFESINPATEEVVDRIPVLEDESIERALTQASVQSNKWAGTPIMDRAALLGRVADQLDEQRDTLAELITLEMGKLIGEAKAEVEKCAWVCRYYAEHGAEFVADEQVTSDASFASIVAYQPLGVVLAIMPWNFPFWQVFRFAAPALVAGNAALLKHASNVLGCAKAIEDVFRQAGAPQGLFTALPIFSDRVKDLIEDPRVQAVTLTGSAPAGRAVAAQAGKALKKSVLELGGSDPFVVLADANLETAVAKAVQSRFMNAGQSCIAAKRFIVVGNLAEEFLERFVAAISALETGDPLAETTSLAPMARRDLREELHLQVQEAVDRGARVLTGGAPQEERGFFYAPTVLVDVTPEMRAYSEELFGPVATVFHVADEVEALRLADATEFGLGASVWTTNREHGLDFARKLECGCAFVNELVKSDPRLPFGGIKSSGYGRELSRQGIREFVNCKTIWID